MSTVTVAEDQQLEQRAITWPERAKSISIVDQETYSAACQMLHDIKDLGREVIQHHAPIKKATYDSWKVAVAAEKKLLDPLEVAERTLRVAIGSFEMEQRRKAEEERLRLEKEALRAQEEALEAAIESAESEGASPEVIEAMISQPLVVPRAVVQPEFKPAAGVSVGREATWKADVTDIRLLARAIADGKAAANLLQENTTALNQLARATRGSLQVPGVRFYQEAPTVRVSAQRPR